MPSSLLLLFWGPPSLISAVVFPPPSLGGMLHKNNLCGASLIMPPNYPVLYKGSPNPSPGYKVLATYRSFPSRGVGAPTRDIIGRTPPYIFKGAQFGGPFRDPFTKVKALGSLNPSLFRVPLYCLVVPQRCSPSFIYPRCQTILIQE